MCKGKTKIDIRYPRCKFKHLLEQLSKLLLNKDNDLSSDLNKILNGKASKDSKLVPMKISELSRFVRYADEI